MLSQKPPGGNNNSAQGECGRKPRTTYVVVAALGPGGRDLRSCGSMTEAILFGFEVKAACVRCRGECPPLRVEMRAEVAG